jgi:DeoR family deoxyribose operon repressor
MSDRKNQRLGRIADALKGKEALKLKDVSELLGVSEMTIRRDIASCDGLFRYLGGYIVKGQNFVDNSFYVFDRERESNIQNKRDACVLAASFIEPKDTIFIDCGTTMPHLARRIPNDWRVTVVCFSLNIANIVCENANITTILLGGVYQPSSASFSSTEALETLRRIGINKAFLSAGGLDPDHGASCSNFHEVPVKQEAMRRAVRKYLVADSTKFGKVRPAFFSSLDGFDAVLTDNDVTDDYRERLASDGVTLMTPEV